MSNSIKNKTTNNCSILVLINDATKKIIKSNTMLYTVISMNATGSIPIIALPVLTNFLFVVSINGPATASPKIDKNSSNLAITTFKQYLNKQIPITTNIAVSNNKAKHPEAPLGLAKDSIILRIASFSAVLPFAILSLYTACKYVIIVSSLSSITFEFVEGNSAFNAVFLDALESANQK